MTSLAQDIYRKSWVSVVLHKQSTDCFLIIHWLIILHNNFVTNSQTKERITWSGWIALARQISLFLISNLKNNKNSIEQMTQAYYLWWIRRNNNNEEYAPICGRPNVKTPLLGLTFLGDSNDSKRHVTPISVNHFFISFETVPNAPIMIGTTVTLRNFQIRFNSRFRSLQFSIFSFSLSFTWMSKQTSNINNQAFAFYCYYYYYYKWLGFSR